MARAHSVWLVWNQEHPVAAFTVKHELATWLSRQTPAVCDTLDIWKVVDGPNYNGPGAKHLDDWTELLK